MTAITIRNVPDEVRDELAARATRAGLSLEDYLLDELTYLARFPSSDEVLERARARADRSDTDVPGDTIVEILRKIRDA